MSVNNKIIKELYQKQDEKSKETISLFIDFFLRLEQQQKEEFSKIAEVDLWRSKCKLINQYIIRDTKERCEEIKNVLYEYLPKVLIDIVKKYMELKMIEEQNNWNYGGHEHVSIETNYGSLYVGGDFHWADDDPCPTYFEWNFFSYEFLGKFYGNEMTYVHYKSETEDIELVKNEPFSL